MGLVSTRRPPDKSPLVQERLDAIYEKVRRSFEENLTTIDDATRRLASGELDDAGRKAAEGAAHRLVGAAAMVGFPEATRPARRLEEAFAAADVGPTHVPRMRADTEELRALLAGHPHDA